LLGFAGRESSNLPFRVDEPCSDRNQFTVRKQQLQVFGTLVDASIPPVIEEAKEPDMAY